MRTLFFLLFSNIIFLVSTFAQDNHCLDFNGVDNTVLVNDFEISGDFTISTWFRCNSVTGNVIPQRIISFGPTTRLEIGIENSSNRLWIFDQSNGAGTYSSGEDLRDGNWHQVTFVKSGLERYVYLDGVLFFENQSEDATYGDSFKIGGANGGSSFQSFFNGKVDETRVWSIAKTLDEIQAEYLCPLNGDEENLLAYWNYDQGTAGGTNTNETTLLDSSPNDKNGNLSSNFNLDGNTSNWISADNDQFYQLNTSITQNGNELMGNTNASDYQWLDCNNNFSEISGATAANFTPSTSGSYALEVSNFACSEVSECFDFIAVSTKNILKQTDILVYPNPTTDFLLVNKKTTGEIKVVITDQLGKVLLVENMAPQTTEIDLRDLPKGLYYVAVENIVRKIVKL